MVKDGGEKEPPVPVDDDKVEVYRSPPEQTQATAEHLSSGWSSAATPPASSCISKATSP